MRQQHILKPVSRVIMPRRCLAVSCHVDIGNDRAVANVVERGFSSYKWLWNEAGEITHESKEEHAGNERLMRTIEIISRSHNNVWLFAFGLRKWMDMIRAWDWIDSGKLSLEKGVCILGNPPNIISATIAATGSKIKMLDLLNYGLNKDVENESHFADPYHIFQWCCWYRQQLVNNDMGEWKHTASSQAWHTFRRKCLTHKIEIHGDENALRLEREAYYGGRCEPRFIGTLGVNPADYANGTRPWSDQFSDFITDEELRISNAKARGEITDPVYHLDVVGSYLGVARDLSVPVALIGKINGLPNVREACESKNYGCVAQVTVACNQAIYPYRWPNNRRTSRWWDRTGESKGLSVHPTQSLPLGAIIYPVGSFRTTICGRELACAIAKGHVTHVHQAYLYSVTPALRTWVDYCLPPYMVAKKQGNNLCRHVWKSIALSLFGKFASWKYVWHYMLDYEDAERWDYWHYYDVTAQKIYPRRSLAGVVSEFRGPQESDDSFPAIAAWINSAARIKLWEYIQCAGHGNVYYYDTDSIWTNTAGFRALSGAGYVKDKELGALSFRGEHNWMTIRGIKDYEVPGKIVKSGAAEATHISRDGIREKVTSIPLESEIARKHPPRQVVVVEQIAREKKYRHGQVLPTGEVIPWTINE